MNERNFLLSTPQVFCLLLFYLLSGMMLFSGGSFFAALFSALFSACLCVIADGVCKSKSSSKGLYAAAFGSFSRTLCCAAAFFSALPLTATLSAFAVSIHSFHGGKYTFAFAPLLAFFCFFGVAGGFYRAARFAELCVFALAGAVLLTLFGGGDGISFAFGESALFAGFDAVGAPAVFFSLYLRCVTPESSKMSEREREETTP